MGNGAYTLLILTKLRIPGSTIWQTDYADAKVRSRKGNSPDLQLRSLIHG